MCLGVWNSKRRVHQGKADGTGDHQCGADGTGDPQGGTDGAVLHQGGGNGTEDQATLKDNEA